jgi:gas vesicle protein
MDMPKGSKLLGGLLIGTAIGALAGLLFAPKAGKETRKAIRERARALKKEADGSTTHPSS